MDEPEERDIGPLAAAPRANLQLRAHRLRRGITQQEVADALLALAWQRDHQRLGVDAGMVSKWERGQKQPRKLYRRLLCQLYEVTETELGLRSPQVAANLDDSGEYDVDRRDFLLSAGRFGLATALSPFASLADGFPGSMGRGTVTGATVDAYAAIAAAQRTLYWSTPGPLLFQSSVAHTEFGTRLLRDARGAMRERFAADVAQSGLLSGRLAFFDLSRPAMAERCFGIARELAEDADDQGLAAAVYGHMAFIPGFAGDGAGADAALNAAHRHVRNRPSPRLASWLHCVEAEITARTGASERALLHSGQAEDALGIRGVDPEWLDFYDPWRLRCFSGYVQLASGRPAEAAATMQDCLRALPSTAMKQRSILLLDLATAHAPTDPDHALEFVDQAAESLRVDWYATAQDRIPAVRAAFRGTRQMAELEDHLAPLAAAAL